jgi:xanthine dehydrogenase YagS FAD-binding subunit
VKPFTYVRARTLANAVDLFADRDDAHFVAGGTNVTDLLKLGVLEASHLIDVTDALPREIDTLPDGTTRIGAGVSNAVLAGHRTIRGRYPALAAALLAGASGQIRNAATVGGNLLQRTRCTYFQDVTRPCNKREPGTGCPALAGAHRDLSVIGGSGTCIATHPGDMAVALAMYDAEVEVLHTGGRTTRLPVGELHRLPGNRPDRDTVLAPGEIVTAVYLPDPGPHRSAYRKVRDRQSYAFALVSVAAAVTAGPDGSTVRLAFGSVAPRPWRARTAEERLRGHALTDELVRAALDAEFAAATPLPGNAFKVEMAKAAGLATVRDLLAGRGENTPDQAHDVPGPAEHPHTPSAPAEGPEGAAG